MAADSRRAANRDSSAALRRRYGHAVVSVPGSRSRSKATAMSCGSIGVSGAVMVFSGMTARPPR
jgi:hypothetical protein